MKAILIDFLTATFFLLAFIFTFVLLSVAFSGDRESGVEYGIIIGIGMALIFFYFLRGVFALKISVIQLILNAAMSSLEYYGVILFFEKIVLSDLPIGMAILLISFPFFIVINKLILDAVTFKLDGQKRKKIVFKF